MSSRQLPAARSWQGAIKVFTFVDHCVGAIREIQVLVITLQQPSGVLMPRGGQLCSLDSAAWSCCDDNRSKALHKMQASR